jgi:hypothetical protein
VPDLVAEEALGRERYGAEDGLHIGRSLHMFVRIGGRLTRLKVGGPPFTCWWAGRLLGSRSHA